MKTCKRVFVFSLISAGGLCAFPGPLCAQGSNASPKRGLPNPFYALSNGAKDENHQTPESQAALLKELGYDGMGYTPADGVGEMVQALDASGLKLFAVYLGANIDPDQPKYDPKWKAVLQSLKGRDTVVWVYIQSKKLKPSTPEGDPRAVEIVREIADLAEQSGLQVALYPHVWFWVERIEDAVRVARKVNRKNVGVTFNLCHWLKVDDPQTLQARLALAKPYLFSVTINGADTKGGWDHLIQTLDRGAFDIYTFLKRLNEMGYTGPIGLQCYGIKGDVRENLGRSMAAWRKLCARMAAEPK